MSFRFPNRETGEIIETDAPVEFWMLLREQADLDIREWYAERLEALTLRRALSEWRQTVDAIEAAMRLSESIDGTNAETRKAQLEHLLNGDEHWIAAMDTIRSIEHDVGVREAGAEAGHSRYRLALRDLEVMAALYSPQDGSGGKE